MAEQIELELMVDEYTLGLVVPEQEWAGTVPDGGIVRTHTHPAPGGPIITSTFQGCHEVMKPIPVEGAELGDAVEEKIREIEVTSAATSTGSMDEREAAFGDDPFVDHTCPDCGAEWPDSVVHGTGEDAIRCVECGANASSFGFEYGITTVFDDEYGVGITVGAQGAHSLVERAAEAIALPENSRQHPIFLYEGFEMAGERGHLRRFLGNIGTTPPIEMPGALDSSHRRQPRLGAGRRGRTRHRTDDHIDIHAVREGAVLICPGVIERAGVYVGDMHGNQGDGELALHTTAVSGHTEFEVELIKHLSLDGPVLPSNQEDLPPVASRTRTRASSGARNSATHTASTWNLRGPIQVIVSGATVNDATETAIDRAGDLRDISEGEVRPRSTFTGGVEIGQLPGLVQLPMLAPMEKRAERGIAHPLSDQYGLWLLGGASHPRCIAG